MLCPVQCNKQKLLPLLRELLRSLIDLNIMHFKIWCVGLRAQEGRRSELCHVQPAFTSWELLGITAGASRSALVMVHWAHPRLQATAKPLCHPISQILNWPIRLTGGPYTPGAAL